MRSERGRLRNFRNKVLELPDQVGIQVLRGALTFSSGRQSSGRRWRWIDRADEERRRISHLIASIFCEIRSGIISENGVGRRIWGLRGRTCQTSGFTVLLFGVWWQIGLWFWGLCRMRG